MDEPENCAAILLAKQTVIIREPAAEFGYLIAEGITALAIERELRFIVMDVHFDIPDSETHHLRDAFDQFGLVTLLRVEKAVLGTLTSGVPGCVIGDARPLFAPARHTVQPSGKGIALAQWLVMIGDGNPGSLGLCGPHAFAQTIFQVWQ
jgi:hypothetical protein